MAPKLRGGKKGGGLITFWRRKSCAVVTSIPLFDRSYRSRKNLWFYGFGLGEIMGKHSIICSPYIPDASNIGKFFRCPSQIREFYIHLKNLITRHHLCYILEQFSGYSKSGWVRRLWGLQTYPSLGRINSESSACGCSFPPTRPGCSIVEGLSAADVWV